MVPEEKEETRRSYTIGDLIRIPVGGLFIYWSVVAISKGFRVLSWDFVSIGVFVLAIIVAAIFIPLGFVMIVIGVTGGGKRRSKASGKRRSEDR